MGNTRTIPPHEDEITGSKGDGKIPKSDLAAWTRTYRLVKAWITIILDYSHFLCIQDQTWHLDTTHTKFDSNRAHKNLD